MTAVYSEEYDSYDEQSPEDKQMHHDYLWNWYGPFLDDLPF